MYVQYNEPHRRTGSEKSLVHQSYALLWVNDVGTLSWLIIGCRPYRASQTRCPVVHVPLAKASAGQRSTCRYQYSAHASSQSCMCLQTLVYASKGFAGFVLGHQQLITASAETTLETNVHALGHLRRRRSGELPAQQPQYCPIATAVVQRQSAGQVTAVSATTGGGAKRRGGRAGVPLGTLADGRVTASWGLEAGLPKGVVGTKCPTLT